jgi:hypothetical protein
MSDVPRHTPISITSAIVRFAAYWWICATSPKVMAHAHSQEEELKAP